jgi:3-oxoadipate enol-lactonase
LIICGDEDDACVEPSLLLKNHLPAAGLTFFPKSGTCSISKSPHCSTKW